MTGGRRSLRQWWADGPLSRPGARWRYSTILVVVAVLASLPALVGAIPVDAKSEPVATLLARVRASDTIPYTGLASATGQLAVPDLGVGADVTDLISRTNRLRVWWASPTSYRVDRVTAIAESDVYQQFDGVWQWDSDKRLAQFLTTTPQIPLPGPQDALPGNLGRRLLEQAPASQVTSIDARWIAGRKTLGLEWNPHDPVSLIGQVRIWVDQGTGLPLAVDVFPVGSTHRAFSTAFLDVRFKAPSKSVLSFNPNSDPTATIINDEPNAPDDNRANYLLPPTIAGLPQRSPPAPLVATYGKGVSLVAVVAIDSLGGQALRGQIDSPSRPPIKGKFGTGSYISAPLLSGLVFTTRNRGYVLLGTVTRDQLEAMALDLVRNPPLDLQANAQPRHTP
jgi:hypothetical protein